jgi:hypothetical protein
MRLALLVALLAQTPTMRQVEVRWNLDPSHEGVTTWQIEADGTLAPCTDVAVGSTYRRCVWVAEARPYRAIRLRGIRDVCVAADGTVLQPCAGAWSEPIAADLSTAAPGPLMIRQLRGG